MSATAPAHQRKASAAPSPYCAATGSGRIQTATATMTVGPAASKRPMGVRECPMWVESALRTRAALRLVHQGGDRIQPRVCGCQGILSGVYARRDEEDETCRSSY